ncbi:DJ-1/PfpI family protein [Streptomyces cocklensis]|uniref:Thiamine biosynthesis protein ThiJ n=1 Tax=Actinacidiphila cocklensis TaxID=887465 RepID=A0A9W4GRT6_9ACTN|nr:DJ-1/PfpI family protein [Actinacidiphila cocklensis]MDD1060754.1 DJ-1/PfpI family protein [Actinacidiphila cocklensis]WSX73725.1 DJ-1/PfpI family protein [Streptomyces sp. NBC_00899]WSX80212.1 DJ-1/PfpI family protein [Streptomyces sp. NBC_00899]CAG6394621.1 Thiamine biosynthesis protein ThiJ [Actinacidiphila cocklensis]
MRLKGQKIAVLMESDFYEPEIFYYQRRFAEEGAEVHFLTRLWGNERIVFRGHEYRVPFEVSESFEELDEFGLKQFSAVIVPSGMVSDRLRYTEEVDELPPATAFLRRAFADPAIIKGIICHGMWLAAPIPQVISGRRAVVHNNLLGDLKNMGGIYQDRDVVVDEDLVTARTGNHCHVFARTIIDLLAERAERHQAWAA